YEINPHGLWEQQPMAAKGVYRHSIILKEAKTAKLFFMTNVCIFFKNKFNSIIEEVCFLRKSTGFVPMKMDNIQISFSSYKLNIGVVRHDRQIFNRGNTTRKSNRHSAIWRICCIG